MPKTILGRRRVLALAGGAAACGTFSSASAAVSRLTDQDRSDIARVETYLNDIRTMTARFMQVSDTGGTAEGKLFLSRPGRLRLEYDPPVPILLVANSGFLIHYDKQLKAVTHLPIDSTPAGLLVRERIALSGDVTVSAVERGPGSLRVTVQQSKDPQAGKITLVFSERPFALSSWQVVDAQGNVTRVALLEPRVGVPIDPTLFRFTDPGMLSPGRNQ